MATNVIHKFQSGFRHQHSCQTALIHLVDDSLRSIDSGQYAGAVVLELSKALDLVDHRVLLHKLKLYHFTPKTTALLTSYLSERTHVVKGDNLTSFSHTVSSGVPQGSIIRPLLFILNINDLPMTVSGCGIDLYADDSILYKAHKDHSVVQQTLQTNLDTVNNWCTINNMSLNPAKTKCMVLATPYKHQSFRK